jgi:hypothetical protein
VIDPVPVPFADLSEPYDLKKPTDAPAKQKEAKVSLRLCANLDEVQPLAGIEGPGAKFGVPQFLDVQDQKAPHTEAKNAECRVAEIDIKASDLITAADKHYRFQTIEQGKCMGKVVLKSTIEVYDLILRPNASEECNWPLVVSLLKLGNGKMLQDKNQNYTGMRAFRLMPADKTQITVHFDTDRDIFVGTRSIVVSMLFLSKGIEVPPQHYQEGLVAPPPPSDTDQPFDWPQVTEGLFRVQVSKCKPKKCFTAVKYRGYWFYIADDDLSSKSTFNLMLEMFNVQVAPGVATAPILTLSASGPIAR